MARPGPRDLEQRATVCEYHPAGSGKLSHAREAKAGVPEGLMLQVERQVLKDKELKDEKVRDSETERPLSMPAFGFPPPASSARALTSQQCSLIAETRRMR
jgi:hypothetical protein